MRALNNGDGTWAAVIEPIGAGGGTVVATAYPNSEENFMGRRSFAMEDDNTNAPQGQGLLQVVPAPSGVYISSYQESEQEQSVYPSQPGTNTNQFLWQNGQGGMSMLGSLAGVLDVFHWPATSWPQPLPGGVVTQVDLNLGISNTWNIDAPTLLEEHCNISFANPYYGLQYFQRTADTQMKLATGGMPGSTHMNVWLISCSATNYSPPWGWGDAPIVSAPIDPRNIRIPSGQFDSNGNLYLVLPDNTNLDVTPVVTGPASSYYTFNVTATRIFQLWEFDDWSGGWGTYTGTATPQYRCTLWDLAEKVTGDGANWKLLGSTTQIAEKGQQIHVAPLLKVLEGILRSNVVSATASLNAAHLGSSCSNVPPQPTESATVMQFFGTNAIGTIDCGDAVDLVFAEGLIKIMGASNFDATGWTFTNLPLVSTNATGGMCNVSNMLIADHGYFQNYTNVPEDWAIQGQNIIKVASDSYWGWGFSTNSGINCFALTLSYSNWLTKLQQEYTGQFPNDPIRTYPPPGFNGGIWFLDTAAIGATNLERGNTDQ